ncbi:MAG: hypothetical protein OEQ18_14310 [Gammaproteobacteria bacterium]|nr:hypothetical protein [Gammaproteobacteria bacterium]
MRGVERDQVARLPHGTPQDIASMLPVRNGTRRDGNAVGFEHLDPNLLRQQVTRY